MARATVEIEMPVCCAACPLCHEYVCLPMDKFVTTDILWRDREKWCPLKEVKESEGGEADVSG